MAKANKYMIFFYDWRKPIEKLSGAECKKLLLAMLDYCENGIQPKDFGGKVGLIADLIFPQLERAQGLSKARADAGSAGGKQKVANSKQNVANDFFATDDCKQNVATITKTKTKTITKTNTKTNARDADAFAAFWEAYPKKVSKATAEKAWEKLDPDSDLIDVMLKALEAQKKTSEWTKDSGQYIPYPATWINQRRWEDQPTEVQKAGSFGSIPDSQYADAFEASLARTLSMAGGDG